MNKKRVRGGVERSERAKDREASMTKARRRKPDVRAVKDSVLTWGDLASRLKGRRGPDAGTEREVSRCRSSDREAEKGGPPTLGRLSGAKGERRGERNERESRERKAPDVRATGATDGG